MVGSLYVSKPRGRPAQLVLVGIILQKSKIPVDDLPQGIILVVPRLTRIRCLLVLDVLLEPIRAQFRGLRQRFFVELRRGLGRDWDGGSLKVWFRVSDTTSPNDFGVRGNSKW